MTTPSKPSGARFLTVGLGLAALLGAALVLSHFRAGPLPGQISGLEARHAQARQALRAVAGMRADLFAAAEAQRGAVLAETDEDSRAFAEAARAARGRVSATLAGLKAGGWLEGQQAALAFARDFDEYRRVDDEVLALAVRNTNLKALALSFGRAWRAARDLELALAPLPDSAPAWKARAAVLRIQALHAPHIVEKDGARMDALEADMARAAAQAREALAELAELGGAPDQENARAEIVRAAQQALDRHARATAEVVRLSRQNTNVRSLALTLSRTTRLVASCDAALAELEQALAARLESRATR